MRVLVACERSGRVRDALLARGHDAVSCDIEPSDAPGPHIARRVEDVLNDDLDWELLVAFPPCTYLSAASAPIMTDDSPQLAYRLSRCIEAAQLVHLLLGCWPAVPRVAVENPKPHKHAARLLGRHSATSQPWHHGDPWTKRTLWWLRGLQPLTPTAVVAPTHAWVRRAPGQPHRHGFVAQDPLPGIEATEPRRRRTLPGLHRGADTLALTPQGLADAIADQWTSPEPQTLL